MAYKLCANINQMPEKALYQYVGAIEFVVVFGDTGQMCVTHTFAYETIAGENQTDNGNRFE